MSDVDTGSMNGWHALGIDHSEAADLRSNAPNAPKRPRGRPFAKGNPGRPVGLRHRRTLAAEALLDGEAEVITRKCIELAKAGDTFCIKLVLERLVPPRRELPIQFTMPPLQSGSDLTAAMAAILKAVADGKVLLGQALEFAKLLECYGRIASVNDPSDLSCLTDAQLRSRILQTQARAAAVDIDWVEAAGPQAD